VIIESADNNNFKLFKSLLTAKGIKKNNLCIVSGCKIVPEFRGHSSVYAVVASEKNISNFNYNGDAKTYLFKESLFNQLDTNGTHFPLLIYKPPQINDYDFNGEPNGLEVITGLGDPSNFGALARSCEAFAVKKLILLKNACHPFLPRAIKASSGSILRTSLFHGPFIDDLPKNSFYSLDPQNTRSIATLSIPMEDSLESLNATIASSIALSSYYQFNHWKYISMN